ncbi:MAG TPA: transketolase C-terminal domain-containing protein [Candidatus Saccharibacteria bacterium]|nr:transketolase C-terminal domain-containing protein [Candidatus Saccharibacteria bacterium]
MSEYTLSSQHLSSDVKKESTRAGFGRGLKATGEADERVVALCADLTESVQMQLFAEAFPERFIQVGVAEQNLVTVASGLAAVGKIPFAASYAAFSPGRNWEQIRTTICLNDQPVKVVGSHAGISVGPDGATHQMLEDIALMRSLPNMMVVVPGDSVEAEKATKLIAATSQPTYLRLSRDATPVFTTAITPFELGKAYVLREGHDITLLSTGTMTYECLVAVEKLGHDGLSVEVVHVPTIKPLDSETILGSLRKTGRAISIEEAQIAGGFGSAVAELLAEQMPTPLRRMGVHDQFGESGKASELLEKFGLTSRHIVMSVHDFVANTPQYHR